MQQDMLVRKLREKGFKVTPQRRAILNALLSFEHPSKALDILGEVRKDFPDISLDTVYRNLNMLTELGVTTVVNLRGGEASRFEIERGQHHHHLVCLQCGKAVCLDFCPMDDRDSAAAEKHGYELVGHAVELYGYCGKCRS